MEQRVLEKKLSSIQDKLLGTERVAPNRVYLSCEAQDSFAVSQFLYRQCQLRFTIVTGIDAEDCFEVLTHFSNDESGCVVTVKAFVRDRADPQIQSITPMIPGAEWIEREIHDLLGITFTGHPNLRKLLLSDDWPEGQYPLRKENRHEEVAR